MFSSRGQGHAILQGALAAVFALGALLWTEPSLADGALAVGVPANVANDGFAYGYSNNEANRDVARNKALYECRTSKNSTQAARRRCVLVRTYHNECVSIAMDPQAGTPGVGWAIAQTAHKAQVQSLANCRATAGPTRRAACRIDAWYCDGNAK